MASVQLQWPWYAYAVKAGGYNTACPLAPALLASSQSVLPPAAPPLPPYPLPAMPGPGCVHAAATTWAGAPSTPPTSTRCAASATLATAASAARASCRANARWAAAAAAHAKRASANATLRTGAWGVAAATPTSCSPPATAQVGGHTVLLQPLSAASALCVCVEWCIAECSSMAAGVYCPGSQLLIQCQRRPPPRAPACASPCTRHAPRRALKSRASAGTHACTVPICVSALQVFAQCPTGGSCASTSMTCPPPWQHPWSMTTESE